MKHLLAVALFFVGIDLVAAPKRPSPEQIRKLMEQTRPGPEHELLAQFAGKWKLTIKAGAGAQSSGRATSYMTMENRFLWIGYSTDNQQRPFKGSFQIGFDRRHEMFTVIAMDTSGTYFVTSRGKLDPKTRRARLLGKDDDPFMKSMGYTKEFAHILDFSRPDRFVITVMFIDTRTPKRTESKGMELIFERLKTK